MQQKLFANPLTDNNNTQAIPYSEKTKIKSYKPTHNGLKCCMLI